MLNLSKWNDEDRVGLGPNSPDKPKGKTLEARYATLTRWLLEERTVAGRVTRNTMTVFFDHPMWKICLNDRALGRVSFVAHRSLSEAMKIADYKLATDQTKWHTRGYKGRVADTGEGSALDESSENG